MNKQIKKTLLTVIASVATVIAIAQPNNKFYASLEDYKNKKPMEGFEIEDRSWKTNLGSQALKIKKGNETETVKVSKLPSDLFTYNGYLIKAFDGNCYIVLSSGKKLCYYSSYEYQAIQYYSETITGELKKFKEKAFEKYLEEYSLLESYKKDKPKREAKDNVNEYFNKTIMRNVKYFDLINAK